MLVKKYITMFRIATEPFIFLAIFSYGVYVSINPQLIVFKVCQTKYHQDICTVLSTGKNVKEEKQIYQEATKWNTICFVSIFIPSLLVIIPIGAITGVVSTKRLLLLPPIITTIQTVILMLCAKYATSSMVFLALAASLTSLYGDIQGYLMLAFSYMAAATEENEDRTVRMHVLGGIIYVSFGVSSFISGILLENYGFIIALSASLVASVANLFFVLFVLKDIPPSDYIASDGENVREKLLKFCNHLKTACLNGLQFLKKSLFCWKNKHIGLLLVATFFTNSALTGQDIVLVLFLLQQPLTMSSDKVGIFVLAQQCMTGFGVVILVLISRKFFKPSDHYLVLIGQISVTLTFLSIGLSTDSKYIFAVTPLAIATSFPLSGITTILTKSVQPSEHSTALSCVSVVHLTSLILIAFGCKVLYVSTAGYFPGLNIILLAITSFLGLPAAIASFYCNRDSPVESVLMLHHRIQSLKRSIKTKPAMDFIGFEEKNGMYDIMQNF